MFLERNQMFKRVIFYNHFGAGDIFESREFVKGWMKLVPAEQYFYAHGKNPRILLDLPELVHMEVNDKMNAMKDVFIDKSDVYVNTWIGRDGQYVLPGIGCTVEQLFRMHNDMLRKRGFGQLDGQAVDYIPEIDYSVYHISNIDKFMLERLEEKILIDNGRVQSMQAENFPMDGIIYTLADRYPHKSFILTHKIDEDRPNIFCTDDIIKSPDGFDLNEISYLSTFCSTLIGRNSGPHVFSQVKKNCMDETKRLVSFTYAITGASFVINTPIKLTKYWSDAIEEENVVQALVEIFQ